MHAARALLRRHGARETFRANAGRVAQPWGRMPPAAPVAATRFSSSLSVDKYTGQKVEGMLDVDKLRSMAEEGTIDTVVVGFTDLYGRFMGKRMDVNFFLDKVSRKGTHMCDYLVACDMNMNPVPGYKRFSWEKGYGDVHTVPDLDSLRVQAWSPFNTAMVVCDVYKDHKVLDVAPRSLLRSVLDKCKTELDTVALAATELEFYCFEDSYRDAAATGFASGKLTPVSDCVEDYHLVQTFREESFMHEARRFLIQSGVPIENSKGEAGKGQHELNGMYSDALTTADRHIVYKQCVKELSDSHQMSTTFMSKPFQDQSGSGCHVHLSLDKFDASGKRTNAFVGDKSFGPVQGVSDLFLTFLGGWIKFTPDFMPFYAPNPNSYKRFVKGSWAPTRLAWSLDNRTAGFRVVGTAEDGDLRIECRIAGADVNPYLILAASLASGLRGIRDGVQPPPCFQGDVYAASELPEVPKTLTDAVHCFETSVVAREELGDEVVDHYANFYKAEQAEFNGAVTDWEKKRYFEQI